MSFESSQHDQANASGLSRGKPWFGVTLLKTFMVNLKLASSWKKFVLFSAIIVNALHCKFRRSIKKEATLLRKVIIGASIIFAITMTTYCADFHNFLHVLHQTAGFSEATEYCYRPTSFAFRIMFVLR